MKSPRVDEDPTGPEERWLSADCGPATELTDRGMDRQMDGKLTVRASITSWKFLLPMILFFTARKASLGLERRIKGRPGLGMDPPFSALEAVCRNFRGSWKGFGLSSSP
jgi:hypothetical protein